MAFSARIRGALVLTTATLLGTTALTPATAATAAPLTGSSAAKAVAPSHRVVTLITGQKADVSTDGSGHASVALQADDHGRTPVYFTQQIDGDQYVFPQQASAALAAGTVDRRLFDVSALIRQGYDDQGTAALPVIAVYQDQNAVQRSAPARTRAAGTKQLPAIHAIAFGAQKTTAAQTWSSLVDRSGHGRDGLAKLWLDQKVHTTLQSETKQIGAPTAWALGLDGKGVKVAVLDTGIDAAHPDLAGRVLDAQNFTDATQNTDTHDAVGHGTFVASEIAGNGAASNGAQRGVADGARLLIGKVLDDTGSGTDSQIIAGMQWASDSGADVVSMSLGSAEPTDCTDPMSVAAENLAKASKSLFVIAAGNLGRYESVSSPGCAPDVLTVGAVDSADKTASFSSRGSVQGVHTLKPEIAAPGVDVTGAAAGGRGVYAYTSMSGTSMATPLVAGSAALLKQRHPDWTGATLKAALVSSADTTISGDVQQTGSGRLRAGVAVSQQVLGASSTGFGTFAWPQVRSDLRTLNLPYTNTGSTPVTLTLAVQRLTGDDDSTVASKPVRLGAGTVRIPAGATVQVPLTFDPTARLTGGQYGDVAGRVVATAEDGSTVSTPFNAYVQPETLSVRVKVIDRNGNPATGATGTAVDFVNLGEAGGTRQYPDANGEIDYQLRPGSFYLTGFVVTPDARDTTGAAAPLSITSMAMPEFKLTKDTVITLDARRADRVEVRADQPLRTQAATLELARWWDGKWVDTMDARSSGPTVELYSWGSGKARTGGFEAGTYLRMGAPQLVISGAGVHLEPTYLSYAQSAHLPDRGSAKLVPAASSTPADLAAAQVAGALVLLPDDGTDAATVSSNAKAAGALGVLTYRPTPGVFGANDISVDTPVLEITADQGAALTARLKSGPVTLNWTSTPDSPVLYNLAFHDSQQVAERQVHTVRDADLAKVTENWSSLGVRTHMSDDMAAIRPWNPYGAVGIGSGLVLAPSTRTAYYTPDDSLWSHAGQSSWPFAEFMIDVNRTHTRGENRAEDWYRGVIRPGNALTPAGTGTLQGERQGDRIGVDFSGALWNDDNPDHTGTMSGFGDTSGVELFANGTSLGQSWFGPGYVWDLPHADTSYVLKLQQSRFYHLDIWQRSTTVETDFAFQSHGDPAVYSQALPLLFPGYDVPLDAQNTVAAREQQIGLSATGQLGYTPSSLAEAALSYSYDGGTSWTPAEMHRDHGHWTASVDHTGASGKKVTLRLQLKAADGASVTQTVTDAYAVR